MPEIIVKDGEPFELALRRFKRGREKAGIISEVKRREFHETDAEKRKRRKAVAVKRTKKQLSRSKPKRRVLRKSRSS